MAVFTAATPDRGASKDVQARVRPIQFGEGYKQRVGDGLNQFDETWSLNFTLRTKAEIQAIDTFLKAQFGTTPFDWTTPEGLTQRFVCEKWAPIYNHDGDCSLSCTFERDYTP